MEAGWRAYWSAFPERAWSDLHENERALWRSVVTAVAEVIDESDLGDCGCGASAESALSRPARCASCGSGVDRHHPKCEHFVPHPNGLCARRGDHRPHDVLTGSLAPFRCTGQESDRLPGRAERERS